MLLTNGITLLAASNVSTAESLPRLMGSAEARIYDNGAGRAVQSPDAQSSGSSDPDGGHGVLEVPGFGPDSAWTTSKLQRLTGGRVIQTMDTTMRVTQGDRRPTMPVLGIDARDPLARGMTEIVSGRWAGTTSEIVVTEANWWSRLAAVCSDCWRGSSRASPSPGR